MSRRSSKATSGPEALRMIEEQRAAAVRQIYVDDRWWFDTREMFVDLQGDLSHHLLFEL